MSDTASLLRNLADAIEAGERDLLHDLGETLQTWAKETGEAAYSRAARILHQPTGGRPKIDDTKAIAEAVFMVERGEAPSLHQAFQRVARRLDPYGDQRSWRSTVERLRRKHLKLKNSIHKNLKVDLRPR